MKAFNVQFDLVAQVAAFGKKHLDLFPPTTFAGQRFTTGSAHLEGGAQFTRWLNVYASIEGGPGIFYDPANPFAGTSRSGRVDLGLQPNARLDLRASYNFAAFDRQTGDNVFTVHIVNLRNTYQFTPRFLLRAIVQFDSSRRRVLGDFLASYELVPGTVMHVGYGSVLESLPSEPYRNTARAFFFKASYLLRF